VFPGTWDLVFGSRNNAVEGSFARQTITVSNSDILNLRVQMQPFVPVPVQITDPDAPAAQNAPESTEDSRQPPMPQVQVRLDPTDSTLDSGYGSFNGRRGTAAGQSVPPGTYRVTVQPMGGNKCLDSITAGGVDLNLNPYVLPEGSSPQPVEVKLRHDCATLKGTARSNSPDVTGIALLLPKGLAMTAQLQPIGQDGSFNFPGLSPGDYRLYALSDLTGLAYESPDGMRGISGQDVHLDPGQSGNVFAELTVRKDPQ
jgi:hypothetical protein